MGASESMHDGDFAFYFADIFVETVQYGNRTGLCRMMDHIKNYEYEDKMKAIRKHNEMYGPNCAPSDYCRKALMNTTITDSPGR